jgi:Transposase DDE domain group 1
MPRRVVAKVEWHPGELYPRVGFVVTNLSRPTESVIGFYNQRGTAEQWIKEGKNAMKWTWLSCCTFVANAVSASASCAGLQSPQLRADTGIAGRSQTLVADQPARKARQDRRKDRHTRVLRDLPNGGGRRAEPVVRGDSTADRWTATAIGAGLRAVHEQGASALSLRLCRRTSHSLQTSDLCL